MNSDETLELLQSAVSLRVQSRDVPERVRRELALVEQTILGIVGPLVRKRVAARLLGVSVQALDRWIRKGAIPVEPIAEGSVRMAIATDLVVDLAVEASFESSTAHRIPVERVRARYQRDADIRDAHNLTVAIEQIAAGRRSA